MRRRIATAVSMALLMMLPSGPASGATATADYRFQGNLSSSVGNAPSLVTGGAQGGDFVSKPGGGFVYRFVAGEGFILQNASSVMPSGAYTIALIFEFDDVAGYNRVLDFKNGSMDAGLYVLNGALVFYNFVSAQQQSVPANTYVQVVLTRDSAGTIAAYTDGVEQFTYDDSAGAAVVDPAANVLKFFIDDNSVSGEVSPGSAARIRIWDGAMSASEVASLGGPPDSRCETDPDAVCGTSGDNDLSGTAGPDVMYGGDGNDTISSGGGNDDVSGDAGNDVIDTGSGDDTASGGAGSDEVRGRDGNDSLSGGGGTDTLDGGGGADTASGGGGADTLAGGGGNDVLDGGRRLDRINGGRGRDKCFFDSRREKRRMRSCEVKRFKRFR